MPALTQSRRLLLVIALAAAFFVIELTVAFKSRSLALVADAFHVAFDLASFVVALVAVQVSDSADRPRSLSYGWQRAHVVGAFFNGVFLLALGVSIVLQSIERFISPQVVKHPQQVLIVGGVGLALNILAALTIHEHSHSHSAQPVTIPNPPIDPHAGHAHALHFQDSRRAPRRLGLGMMGVALHLLGDALNNFFVILSAIVTIKTHFVYADPIASTLVGFMILASSISLVRQSARVLLEGAPLEIDLKGVEKDVKRVQGVNGVHEMHVWSLTQSKTIATLHVATTNDSLSAFMKAAREISECLHHWDIHAVTIQPELAPSISTSTISNADESALHEDWGHRVAVKGVGSENEQQLQQREEEYNHCRLRCVGTNVEVGCANGACCD